MQSVLTCSALPTEYAPAAVSGISPRVLFLSDTRQPLPRLDTFQADATPHTNRPLTLHGHQSASALRPMHHTSWAAGIRSGISPRVLCLPDTRQPLPHFPNRCHSSHRPTVAIKPSSRPLHGHQSASALRPMHHTSWTAGIRSGISPRVLCLVDRDSRCVAPNADVVLSHSGTPAGLPPYRAAYIQHCGCYE